MERKIKGVGMDRGRKDSIGWKGEGRECRIEGRRNKIVGWREGRAVLDREEKEEWWNVEKDERM